MDRRITDRERRTPCSRQDTIAGWAGGEYRYYTPCRACESELFGSRVCAGQREAWAVILTP